MLVFLDMQWFRVVMLEHGWCLKVLGYVLEVGLFVWVFVVCVSGVLTITLASNGGSLAVGMRWQQI
jgi:hypothetical protein